MTDEPDCQRDLTCPTTPRTRLGVFVALALCSASACGGERFLRPTDGYPRSWNAALPEAGPFDRATTR